MQLGTSMSKCISQHHCCFFFNSAPCWLVWARHNHELVLLREWFFDWCVFWGPCHLRSGHWRGEANKHASYLALVFK